MLWGGCHRRTFRWRTCSRGSFECFQGGNYEHELISSVYRVCFAVELSFSYASRNEERREVTSELFVETKSAEDGT